MSLLMVNASDCCRRSIELVDSGHSTTAETARSMRKKGEVLNRMVGLVVVEAEDVAGGATGGLRGGAYGS